MGIHIGNIDDAALMSFQGLAQGLAENIGRPQVGVEQALPILVGGCCNGCGEELGRVVDQGVQPAKAAQGPIGQFPNGDRVTQVGPHQVHGVCPSAVESLGQGFCVRSGVKIVKYQVEPLQVQEFSHGGSQTPGSTGDQ